MPPQTKPRAKEEDLKDFDDLPFDEGELAELEALGDLDLDITEDDLLQAAEEMGDSVELDFDEPAAVTPVTNPKIPSISDAALQMLQKEVRDTQVMVAKFGHDLEDWGGSLILKIVGALQAGWDGRFTELKTHMDERFRQLKATPTAAPEAPAVAELPAPAQSGFTAEKKEKLLQWMRDKDKLPSAAATAQGLSEKLGATVQEVMDFFREKKLIGRGGALKKPD